MSGTTGILSTLQQPTESLLVDDQYAFQPTGSTTAALIAMLHSITEMVSKYGVVQEVALDFSKAFDTVYAHGQILTNKHSRQYL